jgi:hypothetical protein
MMILREEPPEEDEDDPEPELDIVPIGGRNQQCHGIEEEQFPFTAVAVAEKGRNFGSKGMLGFSRISGQLLEDGNPALFLKSPCLSIG